jgi:hypothetical protein
MLLAHLLTTGTIARPSAIALVTAATLLVIWALRARTRWQLALAAGLAQLSGHGLLALLHPQGNPTSSSGCLAIVGRGAELGFRLALVRSEQTCPPGTAAVTPTGTAALAAVLVATFIVLAHGLTAMLSATLVVMARSALESLQACAALICLPVKAGSTLVVSPKAMAATPDSVDCTYSVWSPRPVARRGPPLENVAI